MITLPDLSRNLLGVGLDAFVAKFSPDGSAPAFSTYLGRAKSDGASGIAVDAGTLRFIEAAEKEGIPAEDIIIDPLAMAASADRPSWTGGAGGRASPNSPLPELTGGHHTARLAAFLG